MINITYIYLIENIDNDPYKVYIGKTINPKLRKRNHKLTYGDDIQFNIIDQIDSIERKYWEPIETLWIQTFASWGFKIINNKMIGGGGVEFHSDDTKNKMRIVKLGKFVSEETRLRKSISLKNKIKSTEHKLKIKLSLLNKPKSPEHKDKISKSKFIPIIQYNINNEYINEWNSIKIASKNLNIDAADICQVCKGNKKHAKGFIFRYKIS
jgi:hypothetical protein